ncbi:MAG: murein biosynthesis integral membrane protein MurJ [Armatimonadota bacterium]|nr:murein biosynthesis integral membrane protein MurJ [Armatimonadota bacterium]MDR7439755.1 murein biosynthesis integral membrane protein MurJ [Armatimonadota bacterium]MDR7562284.1 murein biosynthesis integral membrane protein MurJ [Armatimonadota bacterium]MDR7568187.1 murein biosynthesis integral membrane protein MurJ [Armatimonadota bacterium]MDR7602884.1 murein biosynthesis integral membrane protein MurJ [Armatimonadota bacterium]
MTDAHPRSFVRAAALMGVAAITSRLLGIVREVVVAALFGAGDAKGAYVVAYSVPFLVQRLLLGGTLSVVFIPVLTRLRGDDRERAEVISRLTGLVLILGGSMVLLGQILAPWIIPLAAPGFGAHPTALAVSLTRILFVAMVFLALALYLTGYLQAHERFTVPAFAPLLFNLTVIGATLGFGPRLGIHGLALAWVLGTAAQFLVQLPAARRAGFRFRISLGLRHPAVREVVQLALPAMLGLAVVELNAYVDRVFASFLRPNGTVNAVAVLDYAYEVVQAPVGFFAISIATALFPTLSRQAGEGEFAALGRTISLGLRAALWCAAPVAALYLAVPEVLVRVLFERFAFTPQATAAVSGAVAAYGAGLVSVSCYVVLTRAYYALHDMRTPLRVGACMIPLNALLDWLLMQVWGHVGIALATSVVSTLNAGVLWWLLRRRLETLEPDRVWRTALRAAVGAAAVGLVAWGVMGILKDALGSGLVGETVRLAAALGTAGGVYLGSSLLLRAEEARWVLGLVRRGAAPAG